MVCAVSAMCFSFLLSIVFFLALSLSPVWASERGNGLVGSAVRSYWRMMAADLSFSKSRRLMCRFARVQNSLSSLPSDALRRFPLISFVLMVFKSWIVRPAGRRVLVDGRVRLRNIRLDAGEFQKFPLRNGSLLRIDAEPVDSFESLAQIGAVRRLFQNGAVQ